MSFVVGQKLQKKILKETLVFVSFTILCYRFVFSCIIFKNILPLFFFHCLWKISCFFWLNLFVSVQKKNLFKKNLIFFILCLLSLLLLFLFSSLFFCFLFSLTMFLSLCLLKLSLFTLFLLFIFFSLSLSKCFFCSILLQKSPSWIFSFFFEKIFFHFFIPFCETVFVLLHCCSAFFSCCSFQSCSFEQDKLTLLFCQKNHLFNTSKNLFAEFLLFDKKCFSSFFVFFFGLMSVRGAKSMLHATQICF